MVRGRHDFQGVWDDGAGELPFGAASMAGSGGEGDASWVNERIGGSSQRGGAARGILVHNGQEEEILARHKTKKDGALGVLVQDRAQYRAARRGDG